MLHLERGTNPAIYVSLTKPSGQHARIYQRMSQPCGDVPKGVARC
jgi:hypothetical protein